MSTPPRLTTSALVAQLRSAIERIRRAQEHFRLISANPTSGTMQIEKARATLTATIDEFGWSWESVDTVLDALAPEERV